MECSGNIHAVFREHPWSAQGTFMERSGNIYGALREHQWSAQGTSTKRPGNIRGTSMEGPGNIQGSTAKREDKCVRSQHNYLTYSWVIIMTSELFPNPKLRNPRKPSNQP